MSQLTTLCSIFSFLYLVISVKSFKELNYIDEVEYRNIVDDWLDEIDKDFRKFNSLSSQLTWQLTLEPDNLKHSQQGKELTLLKNKWRNNVCGIEFTNIKIEYLTLEQKRKLYLLCRGGKYKDNEIIDFIETMGDLAEIYNSPICIAESEELNHLFPYGFPEELRPGKCVFGEPDLEKLMKNSNLNSKQLEFIWTLWHNSVGIPMKNTFLQLVRLQNLAAIRNGYADNGKVWKEELEIPNLERVVERIYEEIKPLYTMLHSVIRFKLHQKFPDEIDLKGPIPIHLLGNMWGQDWTHTTENNLKDILNERMREKNSTMSSMAQQAEDFYSSLGFPRMTRKFWKYSIFEKNENVTICHGTAANLFGNEDFRMIMCGEGNLDDFYVIHHEMGHIQYYMAYEDQLGIFQEGSNSAFHESIGDAIMHGVMTPQHLHRIGLINDEELFDKSTEFDLILLQALEKIPEIPFAILLDKYRWRIYRNEIQYENLNKVYWQMTRHYRGIVPPENRDGEQFFDAGAKFHVPDGTPYIRYFLSGVLQMDIFKALCEFTIFGKNSVKELEDNYLPLQRCDIYGSKKAGKRLRRVMREGAKIHWKTALNLLTGHNEITSEPFLEYYKPVRDFLQHYIEKYDLYQGW